MGAGDRSRSVIFRDMRLGPSSRCYTSGPYESHYVTMHDGVRIAMDVMLPPPERYDLAAGVPCVLAQTRVRKTIEYVVHRICHTGSE